MASSLPFPPPRPPSTAWRGGLAWIGLAAFLAAAALGACGDDGETTDAPGGGTTTSAATSGTGGTGGEAQSAVTPPPFGSPWDTLGEWNLFTDIPSGTPNARVVPYDLISPLFSDYALKDRYVFIPEGSTITYSDTEAWEFPVGAILVKTFSYPIDAANPDGARDLLETRILFREPDGWKAHTYEYTADDSEAELLVSGRIVPVSTQSPSGTPIDSYRIPNENQCLECHERSDEARHLGPSTRQLDRDLDYGSGPENQIDHLFSIGFFDTQPAPAAQRFRLADPLDGSNPDLTFRVRSYFDANCAHCHQQGGFASPPSNLDLTLAGTDPMADPSNWGACVIPTSCGCCAGDTHDIVPGDPDTSIMVCRVSSTDPAEKMPPFGLHAHEEGVALLSDWIAAMPMAGCQ